MLSRLIYFINFLQALYRESILIGSGFGILVIVSFITWISMILCFLCEHRLPKSWKRDHEKHPYTDRDFYMPLFWAGKLRYIQIIFKLNILFI